jgi:hypothetical protein
VSQTTALQVWQLHTGGGVESSAAITTGNSRIYVGSDDGSLYGIDSTGHLMTGWPKKLEQGGAPIKSSPAIGPDGSVWVGDDTGLVARLQDIAAPPTLPPPPTGTATPLATNTPTPTDTPTATATSAAVVLSASLKSKVKDGQKQQINITSAPGTTVHVRVDYPNGDHQSKTVTTNASGAAIYSYTQGSSKITHTNFTATVKLTAGSGITANTVTESYQIQLGKIDASAEPRNQKVGKTERIFVHAGSGTDVTIFLLAASGKEHRFTGKTGPKGFATFKYTVESGLTKGGNHTVAVLAQFTNNASVSTKTSFKVS